MCLSESGFSHREDIFAFDLIKKIYKFCTFRPIWKDTAANNSLSVERRKDSFPSTLTRLTLRY